MDKCFTALRRQLEVVAVVEVKVKKKSKSRERVLMFLLVICSIKIPQTNLLKGAKEKQEKVKDFFFEATVKLSHSYPLLINHIFSRKPMRNLQEKRRKMEFNWEASQRR